MKKHLIIDDAVPIDLQDKIFADITKPTFGWRYKNNTCYDSTGNVIDNETYDVGHCVANIASYESRGPYFNELKPFISIIEQYTGPIVRFKRIKFNMTWQCPDVNGRTQHVHDDAGIGEKNLITVLYYVNDTDGDTKLFYEDETVIVSPKKGRLLIFPADLAHAGTNPSQHKSRLILNLVFEVQNEQWQRKN